MLGHTFILQPQRRQRKTEQQASNRKQQADKQEATSWPAQNWSYPVKSIRSFVGKRMIFKKRQINKDV